MSDKPLAVVVDDILGGRTPRAVCSICAITQTRHRCPYKCQAAVCSKCWPVHRSRELDTAKPCRVCLHKTTIIAQCANNVCSRCETQHRQVCQMCRATRRRGSRYVNKARHW